MAKAYKKNNPLDLYKKYLIYTSHLYVMEQKLIFL